MTSISETILRDVKRYSLNMLAIEMTETPHGGWVKLPAVEAALTAAMDPALSERAGEVVKRLNARTVKRLEVNWKEGRKCPECDADATRQKCMWDLGGSCPRHDPDAYDPPAWEKVPDRDCKEAADLITDLLAQNAALRAEAQEMGAGMVTLSHEHSMERARANAAEAREERLREALELIADTDPDEGTAWFHTVANAALTTEKLHER